MPGNQNDNYMWKYFKMFAILNFHSSITQIPKQKIISGRCIFCINVYPFWV